MKAIASIILLSFLLISCQNTQNDTASVITSDIDNFWMAYDKIIISKDSTEQYKYLQELFFDKGTPGLKGIIQAKNYTPKDYLDAINSYPKFWSSIRENTYKATEFSTSLNKGIEKLRTIYPAIKPAKIYFTIGALRSNGTTMDSLVLIGSELAMADKNTVTSEFTEQMANDKRIFFDSNPIENLVLLNVHEYVHTQQNPIVHNLLSYCLYEGVAEFVSSTAMDEPSVVPSVKFGKTNEGVRAKFEHDMFLGNKTYDWLWSGPENEFNMRDLGYYIGYEICERYYNAAKNKSLAIKTMIELDYENEAEIEAFVDGTHFFSASLEKLYQAFEKKRPTAVSIVQFENESQTVSPQLTEITIAFSEKMSPSISTGLGELGRDHFPKVDTIYFAEDHKSVTYKLHLEPNKRYQILLESSYRSTDGYQLKPFLIDFKTN